MSVYIFIHVFCKSETYAIVSDQIKNIYFSGIYHIVDTIYYCLVGDELSNIEQIADLFSRAGQKFRPLRVAVGDQTYERFTLKEIRNIVKPEDIFCYIHSKGITRPKEKENINLWRRKMEYFLFARAPDYLYLLRDGKYDTAGIIFRRKPLPHYSGNFWWCRGDYYLRLPAEIAADDYLAPEMYILSGGGARALCLNDMDTGNSVNYYHFEHPYGSFIDTKVALQIIDL